MCSNFTPSNHETPRQHKNKAEDYNPLVLPGAEPQMRLTKSLREFTSRLELPEWSIPLVFLIVCVVGFGLLIFDLGYYMDDWSYVFYARVMGAGGLREMLLYDSRPFAALLYIPAFQLLGFKPIYWHLAILLLRFGTTVVLWLTLRTIWPKRPFETAATGLLFIIYPFFMFQPAALGSTHHWAGFFLFSLSIFLMAKANRGNRNVLPFTGLSLVLEAIHLFTSEYYSGLELIRPIILWIILSDIEAKRSMFSLQKTIIRWLPYLVPLFLFGYWRAIIFQNPPGVVRNEPVILNQLIHEPLAALGFLFSAALKDSISVLTLGWQKAIDPVLVDFTTWFNISRLFISILLFMLVYIYLIKLAPDSGGAEPDENWISRGLIFGVTALLTAGLPFWLVGRTIQESKNLESASRVGIPAMFGAAFLIAWVTNTLVNERAKKALVISFLVAIAINLQLANARGFRFSWEKQTRFYQELIWRAPSIEAGTSIITDQEVLPYMGEYATAYAINTIYQPVNISSPPYWYFPIYYSYPDIDAFLQGIPIEYEKFTMKFNGNSRDSLVVAFEPGLDQCLWILQPEDINLRSISEDLRKLSSISAIERIGVGQNGDVDLPEEIFGRSKPKGWCYYFEKSELARQYHRWDEVVSLWEQAISAGEQPGNGFEYIPFIEAYGHQGDWEQVTTLTKAANKVTQGLESPLCDSLDRLSLNTPATERRDLTISKLKANLSCQNYQ